MKIKKYDFQNGLLELVNLNGRPYSLFTDSGMQKILNPILSAFQELRTSVSTSRESLQHNSSKKCSNLTKKIKEEMADKLFSICIDLGTSSDSRSILGINTQYLYNHKLVFRCIGMHVHRHSNTAVRIAVLVWHCLKQYDLKLKNLISVTSENRYNHVFQSMVSCSRHMIAVVPDESVSSCFFSSDQLLDALSFTTAGGCSSSSKCNIDNNV